MTPQPPQLAPTSTPWRWLKQNLFNSWLSSLFSLVCLWVIFYAGWQVINWLTVKAQWAIVQQNLPRLLVGRYPPDQYWRLWIILALLLVVGGGLGWYGFKAKQKPISVFTLILYLFPIAFLLVLWLIGGGLGLPVVKTNLWNGLLLTLLLAAISIFLSFPLGVLLALWRKSELPILRGFATSYIEIMRGLPLIGILFMAQVMLPLVLPGEWRLDRLLRAIAGLVLFNSAYLAENVRGGLQAIPKGQTEAAKALGLNMPLTLALIVLPQALRTVTPAIVGQFISLFKDTSLLSLFALLELTGMTRSILAQPQFFGRYAEAYVFIGLLYWVFCFTMSQLSRRLERS